MKKIIVFMGVFICFGLASVYLYFQNSSTLSDNQDYYEYFKEKDLVGVDGEINLSGLMADRSNLYNELVGLFGEEDYNYYLGVLEDKKVSNKNIQGEFDKMTEKINSLESEKANLSSQYNVLENKYEKLKSETSNKISNFPLINQYPKYPTGCESVAITMLLQYYGVKVTPDEVISKLKKGPLPYPENGKTYGGNPEVEFVGNPLSSSSYGVYEKPIAEVANMYKSGINIKNNFAFGEVVKIVQGGTPVVVWTSMGLSLPYISTSWIYKPTMETIYWKANEHAVVMIGATNDKVTIADPIGGAIKVYSRTLFENRYNYYGKKALYY